MESLSHLGFTCCDFATISEKLQCTEKSGYLRFKIIAAAGQSIVNFILIRKIGIAAK